MKQSKYKQSKYGYTGDQSNPGRLRDGLWNVVERRGSKGWVVIAGPMSFDEAKAMFGRLQNAHEGVGKR